MYGLPHSPTTSKLSLLGFPQSKSSLFFRAISNTRESSWLILSIFTEQSPSAIRPKRDVRPWKSLLTWSLSSLLKAVLRRGNRWPPPLNLSRTSTLSFLPQRGWGAGGVKEQGITTQEPTRAWTRSGTEGTGETAWTPLHKAAAVMQNRKNTHDMMHKWLVLGSGLNHRRQLSIKSHSCDDYVFFLFVLTWSLWNQRLFPPCARPI